MTDLNALRAEEAAHSKPAETLRADVAGDLAVMPAEELVDAFDQQQTIRQPPLDEMNISTEHHDLELVIAQTPLRGRMSGFSEKDRRSLTPPLFVELVIKSKNTQKRISPDYINAYAYLSSGRSVLRLASSYLVMSADLWLSDRRAEANIVLVPEAQLRRSADTDNEVSPQCDQDEHSVCVKAPLLGQTNADANNPGCVHVGASSDAPPPPAISTKEILRSKPKLPAVTEEPLRNLLGSVQVGAQKLKNEHGVLGVYFPFVDLAVRAEGRYCLRLRLTDLSASVGESQPRSAIWAEAWTDAFEIMLAKKFPGMVEMSSLSSCFAKQGLRTGQRSAGKDISGATQTVEEVTLRF